MRQRFLYLGTFAFVVGAALSGAAAIASPTHATWRTTPPASAFSARVDNEWFPLRPGTRYVYTGVKDGTPSREVVTVTHAVRKIAGVACISVQDRLYLLGRLEERTTDWYAQDSRGNVWYFGESTAELDRHGRVTSTAGTWQAGRDGALPGIFMPAHPRVGEAHRQEFLKGQAEDHFEVIGLFRTLSGPPVLNALLTKEWTPLEPGTIDHKLYVRGIGTVLEQTEKGGNERNELVSISRGR
jgi:hypothetical protein